MHFQCIVLGDSWSLGLLGFVSLPTSVSPRLAVETETVANPYGVAAVVDVVVVPVLAGSSVHNESDQTCHATVLQYWFVSGIVAQALICSVTRFAVAHKTS